MTKFEELLELNELVNFNYQMLKKTGEEHYSDAWNLCLEELEKEIQDYWSDLTDEQKEIVKSWYFD